MINVRTEVGLGIAFFSKKVISNHILKYIALQLPNACMQRLNPHQLHTSISLLLLVPHLVTLLMDVVPVPYEHYLS